jgi:hypothetical protein
LDLIFFTYEIGLLDSKIEIKAPKVLPTRILLARFYAFSQNREGRSPLVSRKIKICLTSGK